MMTDLNYHYSFSSSLVSVIKGISTSYSQMVLFVKTLSKHLFTFSSSNIFVRDDSFKICVQRNKENLNELHGKM